MTYETAARGEYRVKMHKRPTVMRPNRVAAGLSATVDRSQRWRSPLLREIARVDNKDTLKLLVYGTLDALAPGAWLWTKRVTCSCCGNKSNKLALNDIGKARLARARRRKA